jgi:hypothetical protein
VHDSRRKPGYSDKEVKYRIRDSVRPKRVLISARRGKAQADDNTVYQASKYKRAGNYNQHKGFRSPAHRKPKAAEYGVKLCAPEIKPNRANDKRDKWYDNGRFTHIHNPILHMIFQQQKQAVETFYTRLPRQSIILYRLRGQGHEDYNYCFYYPYGIGHDNRNGSLASRFAGISAGRVFAGGISAHRAADV